MSRSKHRGRSAADVVRELEASPRFVERKQAEGAQQAAAFEEYQAAARQLLSDLSNAGFYVATVGDLRRMAVPYPAAVPILADWLTKTRYRPLKEDIVRTLSVPWATEAAETLASEFETTNDEGLRWTMGNALEVLATDALADRLIGLATEPRHGIARQMIVVALGKLRTADVVDVLLALLRDDQVVGHAAIALGKLRAISALPHLEGLCRHSILWVREEAAKAVTAITARPR